MNDLDTLEAYLNIAFANLCSISFVGPPVVPAGRAVEAINMALAEVQRMKKEQEVENGETARHEVQ